MRTKREKLLHLIKQDWDEREKAFKERPQNMADYHSGHLNGVILATWIAGFITDEEFDILSKNGELPAKPKQPDRRTAAGKHLANSKRNA